ncbi:MAG: RagB/SusD family nutrient uptake outer membrane protein [Ferruginibacter sp.]|nr:RagB/SusD family nutrient uptake outer membrane protein [Ferruginibacter sp.]
MKKNLIIGFIAFFCFTAIISCKKSFVVVDPKGKTLTENFYKTEADATGAIIATYDAIRKNSGGFENMITMMNAGSDDHIAGGEGAADGVGIQGFSNYTLNATIIPASFWNDHYQGIFRANILLEKLPGIAMNAALKSRYEGEAKALRGLYYFNLVRMYKNIPLILTQLTPLSMREQVQAAPSAIYAQIEADLMTAKTLLPVVLPASESGRLSKGAVQALLGKVLLYEGKKTQAAVEFADVNGTPGGTSIYGYKLLNNFSDLWVVSNRFNTESIIEVSHTNLSKTGWGNWGQGTDEGNSVCIMVGPRNYTRPTVSTAPDLQSGWSFNCITTDLYNAIKLDPRFGATVIDVAALKTAGQADYGPGYQNTGYFLNKYCPRKSDVSTAGGNWELNYQQDSYVMRLADTYLMEAEALVPSSRADALVNAVRARVGLLPITGVTLADIKLERRLELAGEGHRFFDLVRWGDAASKLASRGFVAGKNEVFPIKSTELDNTKLVQNPGY